MRMSRRPEVRAGVVHASVPPLPPQMCWCISPAGERELMRDRRARKPEYDTGLQYERLESFRARVWRLRAWGSRSRALGFECKVLETSQTCR